MSTADDLREKLLDEFRKTADSDRVYPTDKPWPIGVLGNRGDPNTILALPLAEAFANVFSGFVTGQAKVIESAVDVLIELDEENTNFFIIKNTNQENEAISVRLTGAKESTHAFVHNGSDSGRVIFIKSSYSLGASWSDGAALNAGKTAHLFCIYIDPGTVFPMWARWDTIGGGSSGESVDWADIINKPTTFPPESHTQAISTITGLQAALDSKEPVIALGTGNKYLFRDKTWKEIDWDEIINKPSSFVPSTHGHPWSGIINKPSTFPPSAHSHLWSEITDKPSTFTPSSHVHAIADITSLQTTLDGKQPIHANLTSISNLSTTPSGRFLVTNGSAIVARPLQNSDLPAIAITDTFVVSSQAAMLALSAAERGDVAVRTDLNKSFILKGDNHASLSDWQELLTPTDAVLSVDGRTGVVSLSDKYQPLDADLTAIAGLSHTNRHVMISNGTSWTRRALVEADLPSLSISKITNLQSVLDGKSNTSHNHAWSEITSKPSTFAPAAHGLVSSTHTASGLTTGHVLKALSATTYGFAAITWSEITGKPSTFAPSAHDHNSVYAKLSLGTVASSGGFATSLETDRIVFAPGIYSYRFMSTAENRPGTMSYGSVLTWGVGEAGAGQLAVGWTAGDHNTLMFRSLRNTTVDPDPWWNWKQIYHTGYKPTPDDIGAAPATHTHVGVYEPAITGTANKVLSIQADGTGVKTGSIYDNGNVALIGKTTATPGFGCKLEVEGNTLVNGTLIVNVIPAATTEVGVYLTHENNTIKTRTASQVRGDIGAAAVSHSHAWSEITGKPSTFTPSAHSHAWNDITSKPSTFAPAAHGLVSSTHTVSGLTGGHVLKALSATTYGFAAITWYEVTGKPSVFTPAAHGHPWGEITGKPSIPTIGTERSLSVTTTGWVTIATCATGRAYGEFHVYDSTSSRHNFTKIIASTSYGVNNVSVNSSNRYNLRSIAHVRILKNSSDPIYGGAKLQVYCENAPFTLFVKQFLSQEFTNWKAWNDATPVAEGTPSGWAQDDSTYLQDITNPNYSFVAGGALIEGKLTGRSSLEIWGHSYLGNNLNVGGLLSFMYDGNYVTFAGRNASNTIDLLNIAKINSNGDISISGNRVNMSRRNVGELVIIVLQGSETTYINGNNYPRKCFFAIDNQTGANAYIRFTNFQEGDEIFITKTNIVGVPMNTVYVRYDIELEASVNIVWNAVALTSSAGGFHLICRGNATAQGVTANVFTSF